MQCDVKQLQVAGGRRDGPAWRGLVNLLGADAMS